MSSQFKALKALVSEDSGLARLEGLLSKFNLFEAVGVVRHELRHSDFLAFLLDPSRNHGLGVAFLSAFLQAVRLPTLDLDTLNLSHAYVFREWHHIDILVLDDINHLAVIIENKVDTGEHSDQLNRYQVDFYSHYPGYKAMALYLTPDGDKPSSDDYHAVSYTLVCEVIEKIAQNHRATLDSEIVIVLEHYAQMLRRHIVSDSDVAELCRSIYQKHRQALDLIFEHRPDRQAQIKNYVSALIAQEPSIRPHGSAKSYINFGPREWDAPAQRHIEHEPSNWLPYLGVTRFLDGLSVGMWIAPGNEEDREKLLQMAKQHQLTGFSEKLTGIYSRASAFRLLSIRDYDKTQDGIETVISEKWAEFMRDELPRVVKAVREEDWLWETP